MVGLSLWKKLKGKLLVTILQKISTIVFWTFGWVLNSALGNTVKKQKKEPFKRYFPSYIKLFVIILIMFLSCIFYFYFICCTNQKNVLQKKNERLNLWSIFIDWEIQPVLDSHWLNHWKWLVPDPMHGSWIFCQTESVWTVFYSPMPYPNSVK